MEIMFPDLQNSPVGDDALQRSMAERLQHSTTVTQVGRIHVHMEVFPSSLLFKQGLTNIYKWSCITKFYWQSNIMHCHNYGFTQLFPGQQQFTTLFLLCFCFLCWDFSFTSSHLHWQCCCSHPHWGVSGACCHPIKKVRTAVTELEILFLKSCLLHVSALPHASLWGMSLLTHISTSVDLVSISRQFCLM